MKFVSLVALLVAPLVATATRVSWDPTYDNGSQSLDTVACSDGPNGLEPKYGVFSDLPTFPNITGAYVVAGWGSLNCGTPLVTALNFRLDVYHFAVCQALVGTSLTPVLV